MNHRNLSTNYTCAHESGGALVIALTAVAILCIIAGTLLSRTTSKQVAPFQAASWHEAGSAAEGGVEIALSALRRSLNEGTAAWGGWETTTQQGGSTPFAKKYLTEGDLLSHTGEGNQTVRAIVEVSVPTGTGTVNPPQGGVPLPPEMHAYVIRSTGLANLSGPSRLVTAKGDLALRKLGMLMDFRTNQKVAIPQVKRVIEAIASPVTPFPIAIQAREQLDIVKGSGMIVDSFDPAVAPVQASPYVPTRRLYGTIATNGKKNDIIRLENVTVYGNAAKGGGNVNIKPNASVTGEIIDGFYRELKAVRSPRNNPSFSPIKTSPTTADRQNRDIDAGRGPDPSAGRPNPETFYYKLDKIHLHDGDTLKIKKNEKDGGIAEIWVTGDIVVHKGGKIEVEKGAKAIFYCEKNVTLEEKDYGKTAVKNDAVTTRTLNGQSVQVPDADALHFYGVTPDKKKKKFKIKTNMVGVVYAPDHEFEVKLKAGGVPSGKPPRAIYGSLTGRKFKIEGATQVHYDESLADKGKPFDYTLESWQEDWFDPAVRLAN
jgi:hypothetical protein